MSHNTCTMDPDYVAKRLRLYRQHHGLTQENLAELCGLSTRSIENYESGKRAPDQQALRSLQRGMQVEVDFFRKPSAEEEARTRREIEEAQRNTVVVPVVRLTSVQQAQEMVAGCEGRRMDFSQVRDSALEVAAELEELVTDWGDIWEDIPATGRLDAAREILATANRLEEHGYVILYGRHLERQRIARDRIITMRSMVLTAMPKDRAISCVVLRLGPGSEPVPTL